MPTRGPPCTTFRLVCQTGSAAQAAETMAGQMSGAPHLCGEVAAELEVLEERRHGDGGEEEDDRPEANIWDVRSMRATGLAHKLPFILDAVLATPDGHKQVEDNNIGTILG